MAKPKKHQPYQINVHYDPDMFAAIESYCLANSIPRALFVRMCVERFFSADHNDPFLLGYADGVRSAHSDVQPHLNTLFDKMREITEETKKYADFIRTLAAEGVIPQRVG